LAFSASCWSCCSPNCRMRCTNSCVSISSDMLLTAAQQSSTNASPVHNQSNLRQMDASNASVLQDNDTSRMKLLGSQALPGGLEARRSLNCFECSVHAWSKRRRPVSIPGRDSMVLKRRSARSDDSQRQARGASLKYVRR
jgi:hypothetical protein